MSDAVRILIGDVREGLRSLPERSVHCVVTSPPYWGLRDYGVDGQIGLEATLEAFLGSGTTVAAARQLGRHGVGCELNPAYAELARVRIGKAEKPHTFVDTREPEEGGLFK